MFSFGSLHLFQSSALFGADSGTPTRSFTDTADQTTNYESGTLAFASNEFRLTTAKGGSGTARNISIIPATGANIYLGGSGAGGIVNNTAVFAPLTGDTLNLGESSAGRTRHTFYLARATLGSKSNTLTDNTATAFARLTVAHDDYEGCAFGWTAYAEDADTDARQVRKGRTNVAIRNNSGTEACNFSASADDQAILVTAGTFTCTFDCNSASADTVDLRATCDTSLNAAAETLTFEYRLDCESIATVTPQ